MVKIVLLTGAGHGIGLALAKKYNLIGYTVYATDISFAPETEKELTSLGVKTLYCDVSSAQSIAELKEKIIADKVDHIDVLFNNAGVACTVPAFDVDEKALSAVDINFKGPILMVNAFHELVIICKGMFVFTTSATGFFPLPYGSVYSATKSGLDLYARTLQFELSPFGVKVISLVSGSVNSGLRSRFPLNKDSLFGTPEALDNIEARKNVLLTSMLPEEYAERAVNQLEKATPADFRLFEGTNALKLVNFFYYAPSSLGRRFLYKKLKFNSIFPSVNKRIEQLKEKHGYKD